MQPLKECAPEILKRIKVVLCDIDDTLTWQGRLGADAYGAMEALRKQGFIVMPITGRPAGWCDHIARMWPVDGIVGENGAFYFHYDEAARKMVRRYWRSDAERKQDQITLQQIGGRILQEVPGAAISADQAYREADLAIDFCEDVEALGPEDIARIVEIFEQEGAVAKVSSIHVNGWFGNYDKLAMTRKALAEIFKIDIDADAGSIAFVGDSPNDQPMFAFFGLSVGVANVMEFEGQISSEPAWVTDGSGGAGFAEFAELLIATET
ncbi:MAG: HAD family phosphatase [Rhodospirillaceae bacterium]|nr:HAD family phosphatase [Rhodospirillaceae bacterium]MBL6930070.1 HAD family phosphatase [Rhodospirillales bacterium]